MIEPERDELDDQKSDADMCRILRAKAKLLRERVEAEPDGAYVHMQDAISLLEEAAAEIAELHGVILTMDHCIQSTWRAVPADIVAHFANNEAISSANRLPEAVAWMSSGLRG